MSKIPDVSKFIHEAGDNAILAFTNAFKQQYLESIRSKIAQKMVEEKLSSEALKALCEFEVERILTWDKIPIGASLRERLCEEIKASLKL